MKKERPIKIHLLGEFSIENKEFQFPNKVKKSTQLIILIAYLIMYRHTSLTKEALIEVLWPNGISENPEGALRNLIYRARKELEPFCRERKHSCILSKGNTYSWNNAIPWDIDIVRLEKACEDIENIKDASTMCDKCQHLLNTYGMAFLHDFDEEWILVKRRYYKDMIQRALLHGCKLCEQEKDYDRVLKICEYAEFKHFIFPELMEVKLKAFYEVKQYSQAITYYHKIVELYSSTFNIELTPNITNIHHELLKFHKDEPESIQELIGDLNEEIYRNGAFYCDAEIFRNLYQVQVRASSRGVVSYIVMLQLKMVSKTNEVAVRKASALLKEVLYHNLRRNDVFCHCSALTYAAVLQVPSLENCMVALKRVQGKFNSENTDEGVCLCFDAKEIG